MYKIFLDKNKIFECDISIEGADLNESEVRLLLEAENFIVTFKGYINPNGTVQIPIHKMKGILKEDSVGKITLEVIAEDTIFKPWESEYKTDLSKKVKVKIDESFVVENETPKISFNLHEDIKEKEPINTIDVSEDLDKLQKIIKNNGVTFNKLSKNPIVFHKLIEKYCANNKINEERTKEIKTQLFNIITS